MYRFTSTRRRRIASLTVALVLLAAASATAYFLILASGSGSGSNTLGTGATNTETVTLKASFAPGLTPGKHETLTITALNSTAHASDIRLLTVTPSIDAGHAGCSPSFFKVTNGSLPMWESLTTGSGLTEPKTIVVGEELSFTGEQLAFEDNGTNQNACEGATLTLNLTSTP
jgi:hypothetical protein